MLTAIQDFVKDAFSQGEGSEEEWEIRNISFGGKNIMIERGENAFLAAVYEGQPSPYTAEEG